MHCGEGGYSRLPFAVPGRSGGGWLRLVKSAQSRRLARIISAHLGGDEQYSLVCSSDARLARNEARYLSASSDDFSTFSTKISEAQAGRPLCATVTFSSENSPVSFSWSLLEDSADLGRLCSDLPGFLGWPHSSLVDLLCLCWASGLPSTLPSLPVSLEHFSEAQRAWRG